MSEELRPYTYGTEGRKDKSGVVWFACDPYPTWYRWEDRKLILPEFSEPGIPGQYSKKGTFPGWEEV